MLTKNTSNIELSATSTNQNGETVAEMLANCNDGGLFINIKLFLNDPVLNQDFIDFKNLVFEREDELIEALETLK